MTVKRRDPRPCAARSARAAVHGAHARRRAPGHGRVSARGAWAVRLRARAAPLRQERPLLLDAVPGGPRHRPRLRLRAAGRPRPLPLRGRAARIRQRGAGRLRHDRLGRAAAVVERRRRHVGRQLLRLHAVGRGGVAAPRAEGHRPARHDRRHRQLAGGRDAALRRALPGRVLERPPYARVRGRLEPAAAGRGAGRRVRGDRQPQRVVRLRPGAVARRRARAALPGRRAPSRRPAHPDPARRRLVRQHHAAPHARLRGARRQRRDGARSSTCTPARPITRTTTSRTPRSPRRTTTRSTTTRWSACSPATSGLRSTSSTPSSCDAATRRRCRACAGTWRARAGGNRPAGPLREPPSSASTSTAPSARCATRRAEVCSRSPARAAR